MQSKVNLHFLGVRSKVNLRFFSKLLTEFYELGLLQILPTGNNSNANRYLGHYENDQTGLDLEADWGQIRGN